MTPTRCDLCGIEAEQGQEFTVEKLPFRPRKKYCPVCHERFYNRVFRFVALLLMIFVVAGIYEFLRHGGRLLDATGLWAALLCAFQWIMILPHELGHALAARLLGYRQIVILVGFGKPLCAFGFLGIQWLVNRVPFGGFTLADPPDGSGLRWKQFVFVASGPAVNVAAASMAWFCIEPGELFNESFTLAELLFWANLLVLGENLFPCRFQTPVGWLQTDGMLLCKTLFFWGK